LLVLRHPELPCPTGNNPAEIEMRRRVRKRDVSFGPRTDDGKRAWDTFATLLATTHKLEISLHELRSPQSMKIVRSDGFSRPWACD